jgi:signal transduction histidine kinase
VAHEFNTPLMVINSELEYLSLSGIENESLQKISLQVEKLNNLLNSFILLSKLENNQIELENVDVKPILDEVLQELQEIYKNKNIQIETEISTSTIKTNKNLFKILLKNLLDNAFKYNTNN